MKRYQLKIPPRTNSYGPLPPDLLYELQHPPFSDRHQWVARMACRLLWRKSFPEAETILRGACQYVDRDITEHEITDALESASDLVGQSKTMIANAKTGAAEAAIHRKPKWPEPDFDQAHKIVLEGPRQAEGCDLSPVKLDLGVRHTEMVLDAVYPGNPLLCLARRGTWDFYTEPRERFRGIGHLNQYLVPSPMTARAGLTKNKRKPKLSAHTEAATGPRHILVVEADIRKLHKKDNIPTPWSPYIEEWEARGISIADACMAVLLHLSTTAPLVWITWSGNKSLHGAFFCRGRDEAKLKTWFTYAVRLGADSKLWSPSQFARVPDGTRYPDLHQPAPRPKPCRQTLLYFNPEALS